MTTTLSQTRRRLNRRTDWSLGIIVCTLVVAALVPMLWVFLSSFKTNQEIFGSTFSLPEAWRWENYQTAWKGGQFGRYFSNSIMIAVVSTILVIIAACPAGYYFARSKGRFAKIVFYVYLAGMVLPLQSIIIPLFYQLRRYGLLDNPWGLIWVLVGTGMPFACFLMRNSYRDLPESIFEAAQLDGAGNFQTFLRVALPLSKPAVLALVVFSFLIAWNEYLLALLILLTEGNRTIPLGLVQFQEAHSADYGALFAAIVMAMIPSILVYLALQRSFERGLSAGATKG